MSNRRKLLVVNALVVVLVSLVIELVSYVTLPREGRTMGFGINLKSFSIKTFSSVNWLGYNQIDPLLGWGVTAEKNKYNGFLTEHNCIVLKTNVDTGSGLNILITGGSTSDLNINSNNWVQEFVKILQKNKVNATIYNGGTGGYNSGQELLQLIRDGIQCKPGLQISYSGANEIANYNYVSEYEQGYYDKSFNKEVSSVLLPNTVYLLRRVLKLNYKEVRLKPKEDMLPPEKFWKKNMNIMHGIALANNHHFIGVLQPVVGSGLYPLTAKQQSDFGSNEIPRYRQFYAESRKFINQYPEYIADFSTIFDTVTRPDVFTDECHIRQPYERLVAQKMYEVLKQRKWVK